MAKQYLRMRCPLCGMMPFVDKVSFDEPYPFEIYVQTIGGSESIEREGAVEQMQLAAARRGRGRPRKVKARRRGLISFESMRWGIDFDQLRSKVMDKIKLIFDQGLR